MEMHEVMRQRRNGLGLSQSDLAAQVGVDSRQIRRYEAGEAQPTLPIARAIARALGITPDEIEMRQQGDVIQVVATTRGAVSSEEGAYLWRGELRVFDNEALMGWY